MQASDKTMYIRFFNILKNYSKVEFTQSKNNRNWPVFCYCCSKFFFRYYLKPYLKVNQIKNYTKILKS